MRLFVLVRNEDETGISGTGMVAEGVEFTDGRCAMRWLTKTASTGLYDNIDQIVEIHGHGGKTEVIFPYDVSSDNWGDDDLNFCLDEDWEKADNESWD